jgi:hypothetical protein
MDIFYVTCPKCFKQYYGDVSLLSMDVDLHCPFCGIYFKTSEAKNIVTAEKNVSSVVRLSKDKAFYRPGRD